MDNKKSELTLEDDGKGCFWEEKKWWAGGRGGIKSAKVGLLTWDHFWLSNYSSSNRGASLALCSCLIVVEIYGLKACLDVEIVGNLRIDQANYEDSKNFLRAMTLNQVHTFFLFTLMMILFQSVTNFQRDINCSVHIYESSISGIICLTYMLACSFRTYSYR